MEIYILFVIIPLGFIAYWLTRKKNYRSIEEKKELIIQEYEKQMQNILQNSNNTQETKINLLKQINSELSRNIYFDQNEIKAILQHLSALDK